jgi:pimeloyl-ACP methyl ester carboxylesterase
MARPIVLIHGAWMTPACWDLFVARYQARGYTCLAPAWPFDDRPVTELRQAPASELAGIGFGELTDHYARIVSGLQEPPILIGHSIGGLVVQMLLDRGLGSVGVAIDPAPPRGVLAGPRAIWSGLPTLLSWGSWRKVRGMSFRRFAWSFCHTLPVDEQHAAYEAQVVPTPGRLYWQLLTGVATKVNFRNGNRPPLLITAALHDRTVDAWTIRRNFGKYRRSEAVTELIEFPDRTHWLIAAPGWEEVADAVLDWAESANWADAARARPNGAGPLSRRRWGIRR